MVLTPQYDALVQEAVGQEVALSMTGPTADKGGRKTLVAMRTSKGSRGQAQELLLAGSTWLRSEARPALAGSHHHRVPLRLVGFDHLGRARNGSARSRGPGSHLVFDDALRLCRQDVQGRGRARQGTLDDRRAHGLTPADSTASAFVGESRRRVRDELVVAFDDVRNGSGSRVALLVSQPGWGKTRIVQELYRALAADHPQPRYWPPAIVDEETKMPTLSALSHARKAVYPTRVEVPDGAEMDWMWWGILCQQRSHGQLAQAMFDDATQLYAHAESLMRRADDVGGRAFDAGSAVIGVLGLLGLAVAPPVGLAITVAGAVKVVGTTPR